MMKENNHDIMIRQATINDIESLIKYRIALFQSMKELNTKEEEQALYNSCNAYFSKTIPSNEFFSFLAEINGEIIASSGLFFLQKPPAPKNPSGREAYIMNLYVHKDWRKRGIGQQIMTEIIQFIKDNNISRIRLHATPYGKNIYKKLGFKEPTEPEMVLDV